MYKNPYYTNPEYYFQYFQRDQYYIIETDDVRQTCDDPLYFLRSDDRNIDNLQHGDSITVSLVYPEGISATITCLEEEIIPSPHSSKRIPIDGSVTVWQGLIIANDEYVPITDETDQDSIEDDLESLKPELSALFLPDSEVYTVWLDSSVTPVCKEEADDITCRCAIFYHGPPPPPVDLGDGEIISASPPRLSGSLEYKYRVEGGYVCMAVTQQAAESSATFIGVILRDIAGPYKVHDDLYNNKPLYILSSECGQTMFIMYYMGFGRPYWLFVSNLFDPRGSYAMWCLNTADITDNDITKCNWMVGDKFQVSASMTTCECGQIN